MLFHHPAILCPGGHPVIYPPVTFRSCHLPALVCLLLRRPRPAFGWPVHRDPGFCFVLNTGERQWF